MKKIKISYKKKIYYTLVDDEDFDKVNKIKWYLDIRKHHKTNYARGYIPEFDRRLRMHNYVMNTSSIVDHRDEDGLNNQKSNLRLCTLSQNNANRSAYKGRSGAKGVYKSYNKYYAKITKDHKQIYLGSFNTVEEAGKAYNDKALELFGEFAKLNEV